MRRLFNTIMLGLFLPFFPAFWLACRLEAKRCPKCGESWHTSLVGEWGCEMWKCGTCRHYWELPYGKE